MADRRPAHVEEVLSRARAVFAARFGRDPTLGAAAPGRVNLIGEHTDYNGGLVLPMAIDRVCVAAGAPAADPGVSRVYAADLDEEARLDLRSPLEAVEGGSGGAGGNLVARGSPLSYVAGVAAGFQKLAGANGLPNLDVVVASSVPIGSGLSSSASLEVAVATLLESAAGLGLEPREKALLCQRAEHTFAGVPCGIMDQFISVMGREGHALLIDCRTQEARPIPMPGAREMAVLVMDTGVRHSLAAGEYARRRAQCAAAAAKLGVPELRDADLPMLEGAGLTDIERRRARHVITENARVLGAAGAMERGDLKELGRLMLESHASLRDDYEVSCAELDTLVEAAAGSAGLYGARMTGGGFGGCAVAVGEPGSADEASRMVADRYQRAHRKPCAVFRVTAAEGADVISLRGPG